MSLTHAKKAAAIVLVAAAGAFPTAASAQAQTTTTTTPPNVATSARFQAAQQAVEHEVIARQVQLTLLGTELVDATNVTTSDRASLNTIITDEQNALATDAADAAAATTYAELATVRQDMVRDERVYVVVTAQVHLVMAADNDTVTEAGYTSLAGELGSFVNELGLPRATALLADMTTEVTAASSLSANISAEALALSPAGYPGNESEIQSYNFALNRAAVDLKVCRQDVQEIEALALTVHKLPIRHL